MSRLRVGILGATGMVGQRFVTLLDEHPWFEVTLLAASPRSAGKTYAAAVEGKWHMTQPIPHAIADKIVRDVQADFNEITKKADFVFCALDLDKSDIQKIEIKYADAGIPVISNNSANRWTEEVPILMPEVNPDHAELIDIQQKLHGWETGFIAVKPNCSIQSYVSILTALRDFSPIDVSVTSLQAISGAGKTFETWPEMVDNVIPFIPGEEDKSEREPLKIWGRIINGKVSPAILPSINATCIRVPVSDGHLAHVKVKFGKRPTRNEILEAVSNFHNPLAELGLPSAPKKLIMYNDCMDRPQTKLDRDYENGMGITMGRLREDPIFDWQFISLSHNTIRGAAGGAILMAEFLHAKNYI